MNATKAQATPGPWLYNSHGASATEYSEGGNHHTWRWQVTTTREGGISPEELQANAALLAAAPEMAEALRALFEHCAMVHNKWGENCNRKEADAAIAAARAALDKAGMSEYETAKQEASAWRDKAEHGEHPGRGFCLTQAERWAARAALDKAGAA